MHRFPSSRAGLYKLCSTARFGLVGARGPGPKAAFAKRRAAGWTAGLVSRRPGLAACQFLANGTLLHPASSLARCSSHWCYRVPSVSLVAQTSGTCGGPVARTLRCDGCRFLLFIETSSLNVGQAAGLKPASSQSSSSRTTHRPFDDYNFCYNVEYTGLAVQCR